MGDSPKYSAQETIQIYTDWANYYLERAKSKRKVTDLSIDCRDGLLLADIIEAVTTFKVPDLNKKPKTQQQMFDNVNACLATLKSCSVGGLEAVTTHDISSGRLKAVLALFFALSRYKQASKQKVTSITGTTTTVISPNSNQSMTPGTTTITTAQSTNSHTKQQLNQNQYLDTESNRPLVNASNEMTKRPLSGPFSKVTTNGGTSIPLPASVLVQRRCPPDKIRPLPPTPGSSPSIPGLAKPSNLDGSSRSNSPPNNNGTTHIPKSNNCLRQPQSHGKPGLYSAQNNDNANGIVHQPVETTVTTTTTTTKHSMLDKLKLFNKEKSDRSSKAQLSAKRTSSSSGFSSARSERSDSSLSINNDSTNSNVFIVGGKIPLTPTGNNNNGNGASKKQETVNSSKSKYRLLPTRNSSGSKDGGSGAKSSKNDKKDKSPARSEQSETKKSVQKVQAKSQSTTKLTNDGRSGKTSTEMGTKKSDSKTNLAQFNHQIPAAKLTSTPVTSGGVSTGIPKPMAAIKGTTKRIPFVKHQFDQMSEKSDKQNDISASQQSISSEHKMQIVNPITSDGGQLTQTLSPFGQPINISMTDSNHSKSTHSSSTGLHSNSSESSVIYRPSSESGSEMLYGRNGIINHNNMRTTTSPFRTVIPNRKIDHISDSTSIDNILLSGKKCFNTMPSTSSSTSNINRMLFNTAPRQTGNSIHRTNMLDDDKNHQQQQFTLNSSTLRAMQPLFRGYNGHNPHHVTLPSRTNGSTSNARNKHLIVSELCDEIGGPYGATSGYCSDGDVLRKHNHHSYQSHSTDIDMGYMSEGSSGVGRGGKHLMSVLMAKSHLPTTIEERCRSSSGENLENGEGTLPPAMEVNGSPNAGQQRNGIGGSNGNMNNIGGGCGGREQWGKMLDTQNKYSHQLSPQNTSQHSPSRKDKGSPSHSRRSTPSSSKSSSSSRTKGVPQSFGYIKRANGHSAGSIDPQQSSVIMLGTNGGQMANTTNGCIGRTAHVSAVPRSNKIKVSGGTQTCTSDLQTNQTIPTVSQHRSFSLTGPGAAQLSQSIRERLATGTHSLPKPGTTDLHVFQHRLTNRGSGKLTDGSLSDTQTYAEVKTDYSTYAMWLKHSNTASCRLSEGDSLENIGLGGTNSPCIPRSQRMFQKDSPFSQSQQHHSHLNRSNSIRSTKSEKLYPSMLSRAPDVDIEPYYCLPVGTVSSTKTPMVPWSQPTSPTPPNRGFNGPLSPTHNSSHRLTYPKKNDDAHGSAASLLSGGSSLYGSTEERQVLEVRRLKRELIDAREQVMSLSSQLSTNAHVVAAFEQSLSNMTQRLHQVSASAERKEGELTDLRQTIELLRKQSIQAGLTSAHIQSMGEQNHGQSQPINSNQHTTPAKGSDNSSTSNVVGSPQNMQRHHSTDSMCSLNSLSSSCSTQDKKKKKGWLRSSFTKAFSRNAKISKTNRHPISTATVQNGDSKSIGTHPVQTSMLPPSSPIKPMNLPINSASVPVIENAKPLDAVDKKNGELPIVEDLKKQLREKDMVLTDIRLEALSSASQLENLKDTVQKMKQEMMNLKQNNERLQKLVTSRSLAGSEVSLGSPVSPAGSISGTGETRRYSLVDRTLRPPLELPKSLDETEEENIPPAPAPEPPPQIPHSPTSVLCSLPPTSPEALELEPLPDSTPAEDLADKTDGKKISIAVYLGQPESFPRYMDDINEQYSLIHAQPTEIQTEFIIAYTYISGKTTWQNLDYIVRKTFKDYLSKIDNGTNLGLNTDSITSYHLGEAKRGPEIGFPELLPCGYIVGDVRSLFICLQGVGSLAFDSLIPRSIVHRYISLLTEHRRLILCGPSGTGKSYLARKLAEFLVARTQRGNIIEAIATFNVDHKSAKELKQYLGHIGEQASMSNGAANELPSVIILDNLHHATALGDVFQVLLGACPVSKLPCIIGTMSQATCNTTNLQIHHNFRWILTANHMEPVKGFLARFLRRRLYTLELTNRPIQPALVSVFSWLPIVWQHINRFLETHNSSDVTIGPKLFLSCPLDLDDSQVWFCDMWNYHLAPYLIEAVREGVQLYGRRGGAWIDPSTFIRETYPWPSTTANVPLTALRAICAEDVGLDGGVTSNCNSQDPLLNMLMRLQEAANYSGNHDDQESDCASLDSNITQDSSAGVE